MFLGILSVYTDTFSDAIGYSIFIGLLIAIVFLFIVWYFIKSAVSTGTKEAIMECYKEISLIENDNNKKDRFFKTIEDDIREEMNNW